MTADYSDPSVIARVWFVDVGVGDCTLIVDTQTRRAVLIDCPSRGVKKVQEILEDQGAALETVIVTHWDLDHYGGASRLGLGLPVKRVLYNHDTLFATSAGQKGLIRTTLKSFLDIPDCQEILSAAEAGNSGATGEVRWSLLAPTHAEVTKAYIAGRRNVASAVVDVTVADLRVLVGGDAVGATWSRLVGEMDLTADVLRWPHHGADLAGDSDGSIREAVMAAVRPSRVVVSTGAINANGHPSVSVIGSAAASAFVSCTEVTAGCFGFMTRSDRMSAGGRAAIAELDRLHCAGSIVIDCHRDGFVIRPSESDASMRIGMWPRPLCSAALARVTRS